MMLPYDHPPLDAVQMFRVTQGHRPRVGDPAQGVHSANGLTIAALLILLSPGSVVAQSHHGLVSISAASTLSGSALREWDALVDQMINQNELVIRAAYDDRSVPDRRHERLSQHYRGVPVYGGDVSRQTARGVTVSMFGTIYTQIDLNPTATLSRDEATAIFENASGTTLMRDNFPTLTILPILEGRYVLTYVATMRNARTYFVDAHTGLVLMELDEMVTQSAVGSGQGALGDAKKVSANRVAGTFRTQDQLRPAEILTLDTRGKKASLDRLVGGKSFDSDIATDSDNTWTDAGVVDAHVHMGWAYDYFSQRHGWAGLDGEDSRVFDVINDFSVLPNNAFFVRAPFGPEGKGLVAFGETAQGTPVTVLDVAAHEFMHGVTYFSISRRTGTGLRSFLTTDGLGPDRIVLEGEVFGCEEVSQRLKDGRIVPFWCVDGRFVLGSNPGGAINEAFADVFGTSVEFFFQESGSGTLRADYLEGEDLSFGPIRSLRSPQSLIIKGPVTYPDHFDRRLRFARVILEGTRASPTRVLTIPLFFLDDLGNFVLLNGRDNGAVHWNSTILSHAFYLAVEGGYNATSGLSVQGVGSAHRERIEQVFFRAITEIMPSSANFPIAAAVLRQSARDLFAGQPGDTVCRAMDQALLAVGL